MILRFTSFYFGGEFWSLLILNISFIKFDLQIEEDTTIHTALISQFCINKNSCMLFDVLSNCRMRQSVEEKGKVILFMIL